MCCMCSHTATHMERSPSRLTKTLLILLTTSSMSIRFCTDDPGIPKRGGSGMIGIL
jgi:hypothetical protein